ncbi:MAG: SRPBCC domain-containing protein [Ilumatobacteraceae bacterium]
MTTPATAYRFELELTVSATPEQVWDAIATAEGISAWMLETELDPREGGAVTFRMGPDVASEGTVTAFEPTRRIAYEEDWATLVGHAGADVTPLATEFLVDARSGGTCVVRVVTSAYGTGADWENEFWEEMVWGWAPMLDNLRIYLAHFAGQRATATTSTAMFAVTPVEAIDRVRAALGVATVGDHVDAAGVDGIVERTIAQHFLVRIERPVPGLVSCFSHESDAGTVVSLSAYLYGPEGAAAAERLRPEWQSMLEQLARDQAVVTTS